MISGRDVLIYLTLQLHDWFYQFEYIQNKKDLDFDKCKNEYDDYITKGVRFVTAMDTEYPQRIKDLSRPPFALAYKGNINLLEDSIVFGIMGQMLFDFNYKGTIACLHRDFWHLSRLFPNAKFVSVMSDIDEMSSLPLSAYDKENRLFITTNLISEQNDIFLAQISNKMLYSYFDCEDSRARPILEYYISYRRDLAVCPSAFHSFGNELIKNGAPLVDCESDIENFLIGGDC